jgi:hypothetical protein
MSARFNMQWRKRTQWLRFAQTINRASSQRLMGRIGEVDCEFVYSPALMARLTALQEASGVSRGEVFKQVSVITREARLCLKLYGRARVGNYLFIEPVESIIWFRHCRVQLNLMAIHTPNMVVICLLSEAPVDECFWVDRMLNTVSLRMTGEEGGM